jgi:hypothetical protein
MERVVCVEVNWQAMGWAKGLVIGAGSWSVQMLLGSVLNLIMAALSSDDCLDGLS